MTDPGEFEKALRIALNEPAVDRFGMDDAFVDGAQWAKRWILAWAEKNGRQNGLGSHYGSKFIDIEKLRELCK